MLLLSGGLSVFNLVVLCFFPMAIPMIVKPINVWMLRLCFIGMIERKGGYILFSCLLIFLMIFGAKSIAKKGVLLPVLNLLIFLVDLGWVIFLFVSCLNQDYFNIHVVPSGVWDMAVIILFVVHFMKNRRKIEQ